ncbi:DoxX family protein [Ekhidna sp.]
MKKKISRWIQAAFYIYAGANHFINPEFYYDLIPPYLGNSELINSLSGIVEVLFGIGLMIEKTRKLSAYGIILMLIAFIPSHIYFIQIGSCIENGLCVPQWVGWIRLILIHPLLILWAWSDRK